MYLKTKSVAFIKLNKNIFKVIHHSDKMYIYIANGQELAYQYM